MTPNSLHTPGEAQAQAPTITITNLKHTDINVLAQLIQDAWQAPLDG